MILYCCRLTDVISGSDLSSSEGSNLIGGEARLDHFFDLIGLPQKYLFGLREVGVKLLVPVNLHSVGPIVASLACVFSPQKPSDTRFIKSRLVSTLILTSLIYV